MRDVATISNETIAAIATAQGEGGIAVVRISGPNSLAIADALLHSPSKTPSEVQSGGNAVIRARFLRDDKPIDEVLALVMRAPHSYTKEDVLEIQCHGGILVSRLILRAVLAKGARQADPGEFTLRAFLNGRIDLIQAEAVADLIGAESERAAIAAMDQLQGGLSREFATVYGQIVALAGNIEASLDFSEEDTPPLSSDQLQAELSRTISAVEKMLASFDEGKLLRDGARVVISGKPNVGKSTLLNRLLQSNRAIVSHLPGTTRDTIEERIVLDGFPVVLCDTAGLRATECEIEEEGIRRTIDKIESANIHIYLVDSQKDVDNDDLKFLRSHSPSHSILVRNKIDLGPVRAQAVADFETIDAVLTADRGLEEIKEAIRVRMERNIDLDDSPHSAISERHYRILTESRKQLFEAHELLSERSSGYEVLAASNLRAAADSIGLILGRNYQEEVLASVFSNFCIGK